VLLIWKIRDGNLLRIFLHNNGIASDNSKYQAARLIPGRSGKNFSVIPFQLQCMSKIFFYKTSEKKVRGIVIEPVPGQDKPLARKYEYIYNSPAGISTFLGNMKKKFPNATHVNFYCRKTNSFIEKIYLE
jgi:hypothetical protein